MIGFVLFALVFTAFLIYAGVLNFIGNPESEASGGLVVALVGAFFCLGHVLYGALYYIME